MSMMAMASGNELLVSADPYTLKETEYELELVFQTGYSYEEFKEAAMLMDNKRSEYGYAKPKVIFKNESRVYIGKKYKELKELSCYFFVGNKTDELCYSQRGRTGYHVFGCFPWRNVEKIVLIHRDRPDKKEERKSDREKLMKRVLNARFDEKTWSNLTEDSLPEARKNFYYIKNVFDEYDMARIQKAFENKEEFNIQKDDTWKMRRKGNGRHYSASGKMCDDGVYRAWFSSEFAGCANGDYYLLLNPQVAVFCERD